MIIWRCVFKAILPLSNLSNSKKFNVARKIREFIISNFSNFIKLYKLEVISSRIKKHCTNILNQLPGSIDYSDFAHLDSDIKMSFPECLLDSKQYQHTIAKTMYATPKQKVFNRIRKSTNLMDNRFKRTSSDPSQRTSYSFHIYQHCTIR